jgi:hypothetical protein
MRVVSKLAQTRYWKQFVYVLINTYMQQYFNLLPGLAFKSALRET